MIGQRHPFVGLTALLLLTFVLSLFLDDFPCRTGCRRRCCKKMNWRGRWS